MLEQLPLLAVIAACQEHTRRFRCRAASDPRFCHELWRRAIDLRDSDAWQALVEQYQPLVRDRLRQAGLGDELVEEATQQTFVNLWLNSRQGAFSAAGRTLPEVLQYLLNTVRYTLIAVRRQRHDLSLPDSPDGDDTVVEDCTPDLDAQLDARALLAHIRADLQPEEWQVLHLRYCEGAPPREIATMLALPVRQVYLVLADVKRRLRARSDMREWRDRYMRAE